MDAGDERQAIAHQARTGVDVLDEGGSTDLDEHLATGSEAGLRRTTNLFPELT